MTFISTGLSRCGFISSHSRKISLIHPQDFTYVTAVDTIAGKLNITKSVKLIHQPFTVTAFHSTKNKHLLNRRKQYYLLRITLVVPKTLNLQRHEHYNFSSLSCRTTIVWSIASNSSISQVSSPCPKLGPYESISMILILSLQLSNQAKQPHQYQSHYILIQVSNSVDLACILILGTVNDYPIKDITVLYLYVIHFNNVLYSYDI